MSHAPQSGQAPDQASSGRQTGAAAHTRTDHSQSTQRGQSPDESHATRRQPGWRMPQTDTPPSLTVTRAGHSSRSGGRVRRREPLVQREPGSRGSDYQRGFWDLEALL
jgi:hypothetical protein